MTDRSAPVLAVRVFEPGKSANRVDVSELITDFAYEDTELAADRVEMTVNNFDLSLFDDPIWKTGNRLDLTWGYFGDTVPTREAVITSIKGSTLLKVTALAKSILMNKKPISKVFSQVKRSDVARAIAEANGYGPDQQFIDDTSVVLPHVVQAKLTDAQLLKDMAAREGYQFYVDFDGFHFHRRKMGKAPIRTLTYYIDPGQGDIISFNVENDITVKPGAVTAKGRDPLKKKDISVTADNGSTNRAALQPVIEVIDPRTGQAHYQPLAAEHTMLTNAHDAASAKREADGRFIKAQQTTALMTVQIVGDPRISAKKIVEIKGISKRLSGRYYITKVRHKVSASEYTMELAVRTDGSQGLPATKNVKNVKNDGKLNTKGVQDPAQLSEKIDPRTGKISYVRGDTNKAGET